MSGGGDRPRAHQRPRRTALLIAGVLLTGAMLLAYGTDALRSLDLHTVDTRFRIRGTQAPPKNLIVVQVDDVTFEELGKQWPFPRSMHGRLIDRLHAAAAKVNAYDEQYTDQTTAAEDDALITAVQRAGNVVLATTEIGDHGESNVFGGDSVLREIGARAGASTFTPDPGGVLRRMPYAVKGLEGFPLVVADQATGRRISQARDDGTAWIDYRGPPGTIPTVSFSRAYSGRVPPSRFRGKIVVIGAGAPSLQDVHPTSTTRNDVMSGPEIQANAIATAMRGFPLRSTPAAVDVLLIVLLGLITPLASLRLTPARSLALALGAGAAFAAGAQIAFDAGRILPVAYPLGALALTGVASLGIHYLTAAYERERIHAMFARFVPEQVVDEVVANADDELRLGGVRRECTVLFSDLRGFTSFAEQRAPDEVIAVLNRYLTSMSDAILDAGGTLVAYMGDGIMAVFGAPMVQDDHADRALVAAREMLRQLEGFNAWLRDEGLGDGFRMGIGVNSGVVMSGNVGSERRLEYTALGDTTNTAARLEGMTKGTPHQLFVAESTRDALLTPADDLVFVGEQEVRGRVAPIRLWSLP